MTVTLEFHKVLHNSEQQTSKKMHDGRKIAVVVNCNMYRGYFMLAMEVLHCGSPWYLEFSLPDIRCRWNETQASDPVKRASLWLYDNRSSQNMLADATLYDTPIIGALSKVEPPAIKLGNPLPHILWPWTQSFVQSLLGLVANSCLIAAHLRLDERLVPLMHNYRLPSMVPLRTQLKDTCSQKSSYAMPTSCSVIAASELVQIEIKRRNTDIFAREMQASNSVRWNSHVLSDSRWSQNMVAGGRTVQLFGFPFASDAAGYKGHKPVSEASSSTSSDPKAKRPMSESDSIFQQLPSELPVDAEEGVSCSVSAAVKWPVRKFCLIPVYERMANKEDKLIAEVSISACRDYYTFAKEVLSKWPYVLGKSLPHTLWSWAPRYQKAEYFWKFYECETALDPLVEAWDSFWTLQYVAVYPDVGEEPFGLTVYYADELLLNLRFPLSIASLSYQVFRQIIYFYYQAYKGLEPGFPVDMLFVIWPHAHCWYRGARGDLLQFPGDFVEIDGEAVELDIPTEQDINLDEGDAGRDLLKFPGNNVENDGEEVDIPTEEDIDLDEGFDKYEIDEDL